MPDAFFLEVLLPRALLATAALWLVWAGARRALIEWRLRRARAANQRALTALYRRVYALWAEMEGLIAGCSEQEVRRLDEALRRRTSAGNGSKT